MPEVAQTSRQQRRLDARRSINPSSSGGTEVSLVNRLANGDRELHLHLSLDSGSLCSRFAGVIVGYVETIVETFVVCSSRNALARYLSISTEHTHSDSSTARRRVA